MRRALLPVFVCAVGLLSPVARGGGGSSPTPMPSTSTSASDLAAARALFQEGINLFDKGDYQGALEKFRGALAVKDVPSVRMNIARCHDKLGQVASAFGQYKIAAADAASAGNAKMEKQATDAADAIASKVPYLTVKIAAAGATAKVDGQALALGVAVAIDPGKYTVVASAPKVGTKKIDVTLAEGDKKTLVIALP